MTNSKKLPAVLGFIALAAGACLVLYLILGVEPAPEPVFEAAPVPEPAPEPAPEPGPEPGPEPAPEPTAEPEPQPEPELVKPRPASPPPKAVTAVKDDQPPSLRISTPRDRSYVMARLLPVRVRSEAGARVKVNGNLVKEISPGVFSGSVKLKPGDNRLEFEAGDAAGNDSSAVVQVTFVEPKRIRRVKTRFTSLLDQLEEVRSTAEDIDRRTETIIGRIEDIKNAETVNRLSRELREIRNARRELQKEIEKAIREIDGLLDKHQ
jgi:hypothetical protein